MLRILNSFASLMHERRIRYCLAGLIQLRPHSPCTRRNHDRLAKADLWVSIGRVRVNAAICERIQRFGTTLDDFERALKTETTDKEYARGMELIYNRLYESLKKLGLGGDCVMSSCPADAGAIASAPESNGV